MSTKHTPGPWTNTLGLIQGHVSTTDVVIRPTIALVAATTTSHEANARLIAAAPEMLAQLERCLENIRTLNAIIHERCPDLRSGTSDTERMTMQVIAKARGES